jgi:Zn-dependent protease
LDLPNVFRSEVILALPVLLFSIVLHEFAHAYTAYLAGDTTAASQGRLTLNPIAHIDPIGTVVIPLIQFLSPVGLPLIGWAKPVPVNPLRFRSSEWDIFVSMAGPGSNFILVVITTLIFKILVLAGVYSSLGPLLTVLNYFILINLALGIFNLIPIPPLDGSRVVYRLLASGGSPLADKYAAIEPYGFIILILILMTPLWKVFGWVIRSAYQTIIRFIA